MRLKRYWVLIATSMLTSMYAYTFFFVLHFVTISCLHDEFGNNIGTPLPTNTTTLLQNISWRAQSFRSTRTGPKHASSAFTKVPPEQLPKIPQRKQSFRDIREIGNYIFVDKTNYINELLDNDEIYRREKIYFLARPRNFGKSFFLDMVHEFLKGSKKLFKNTVIHSRVSNTFGNVNGSNKNSRKWKENPVIYLNFGQFSTETPEYFKEQIKKRVREIAESYSLRIQKESDVSVIQWLVYALKHKYKSRVSILIDNYDHPVNIFMKENHPCPNDYMLVLEKFYFEISNVAVSKSLWLVLIFGISKLNVIEALNYVETDITFDARFSLMLGFTAKEIEEYFHSHLAKLANNEEKRTISDIIHGIKKRYGGYYFSTEQDDPELMNAGSVCSYLQQRKFLDYEIRTTSLTDVILPRMRNEKRTIRYFSFLCVKEEELLSSLECQYRETAELYKIMFYNGYLSIKAYHPGKEKICVSFPNVNIQERINSLLPLDLQIGNELVLPHNTIVKEIFEILRNNDVRRLVEITMIMAFKKISASLSSADNQEIRATSDILKVFHAIGLDCAISDEGIEMCFQLRDETMRFCGDLDLIIYSFEENTPHYVIEVKLLKEPEEAVLQLIKYMVTQKDSFEREVFRKHRTEMINLVGFIFKHDKYYGNVIWKWISVPYSIKDDKFKINEAKASDDDFNANATATRLKKRLMKQQYYQKNKDRFVL